MSAETRSNRAQLGCGTLVIIAIIVMLFSRGSDSKKLRVQLDELNQKIDRLEAKVDELSMRPVAAPASATGK